MKTAKCPIVTFRLSTNLIKEVEKFASILETNKSDVIRLSIMESINRYLGPKKNPDQIISHVADQKSEIVAKLKDIRMRNKLESLAKDEKQRELITKTLRKYK